MTLTSHCSFCLRSRAMVRKLISSPTDYPCAYICDQCVAACSTIIKDSPVDPPTPPRTKDLEGITPDPRFRLVVRNSTDWRGKILLLGPAGGLTKRFVRLLARVLQVPFAIVDATPRT